MVPLVSYNGRQHLQRCASHQSTASALHYGQASQVLCCTMKIDLGFTVAGSRSSIEAAKKILEVLQSMGHEVLTIHRVSEDAWEADRRGAPRKIFPSDRN